MKTYTKLCFSLAIMILGIFCVGCQNEQAVIFLSNQEITQKTYLTFNQQNLHQVFDAGERIYYYLVSKKTIPSKTLELKIFEGIIKPPWLRYELVQTKTIPLTSTTYLLGNVFVHKTGHFILALYIPNADKPLTMTEFQIR